MTKWLCMVDIDNTLARSRLGIHPGDRVAWSRALAAPIRAIPAAVRTLPEVAKLADVAVVSGRPDYVEAQTRRWIRRHFPEVPCRIHLCPVGTDPRDFEAAIFRSYQKRYASLVCAIDDVYYAGPRHFFLAPRGWTALRDFLQAAATPEPAAAKQGEEPAAAEPPTDPGNTELVPHG